MHWTPTGSRMTVVGRDAGSIRKSNFTTKYIYFFENNNLFVSNQFGYRRGYSVDLVAITLHEQILQNMNMHLNTVAIFMDLCKAFDTIDHRILIKKLRKYYFSECALSLVQNYLTDRQQFVLFRGTESSRRSPSGVYFRPLIVPRIYK